MPGTEFRSGAHVEHYEVLVCHSAEEGRRVNLLELMTIAQVDLDQPVDLGEMSLCKVAHNLNEVEGTIVGESVNRIQPIPPRIPEGMIV